MVDDDEQILAQMRWSMQDDHDVLLATNEIDAIHLFEWERPPVTTIDLSLDPNDPLNLGGLRLLDRFLSIEPATRAIVITANHDEANAIRAVKLGAIDYYTKPLRLHEIKVMVRRAHRVYQLQQKIQDD